MKLGDLYYRMRMLENFQTNLERIKDNKEVQKMLISQAINVVAEIDNAIKSGKLKAIHATNMVKYYNLQPIMKRVRNQ